MKMSGSASIRRRRAAPERPEAQTREPGSSRPREPGSSRPHRAKDLREPDSPDPRARRRPPSSNQLHAMVLYSFIDCPCRFCFDCLQSQVGKGKVSWLEREWWKRHVQKLATIAETCQGRANKYRMQRCHATWKGGIDTSTWCNKNYKLFLDLIHLVCNRTYFCNPEFACFLIFRRFSHSLFYVYFRFWEDLPSTFPKSECIN